MLGNTRLPWLVIFARDLSSLHVTGPTLNAPNSISSSRNGALPSTELSKFLYRFTSAPAARSALAISILLVFSFCRLAR